ncbi:MAG: 16S rRNA (cytosine(967)-C(5))-methyltransferase RsmB [Chromatiales bacterium]
MNPRLAAIRVALRVVDGGESLSRALPAVLGGVSTQDRALVQELSYGVLRWHLRLEALVRALLSRPLRRRDQDVAWLLELGLYQLIYMRLPDYAAIDQTVEATREIGKPWASGLTNAVLRRYLREADALGPALDERDPGIRYAMPAWLIGELQGAYPRDWSAICEAANTRPPMTLRVNRRQVSRETYLTGLRAAGIEAEPHPIVETAITLRQPVPIERLPGFDRGRVSVQDAAAQLAAPLLALEPDLRVLDACAAPGGKTAALLESVPDGLDLTAVDVDPERATRIDETLRRVGLPARVEVADAATPQSWWDRQPYDRILLDAPCSATGVIRRHPDIKLHRRADDLTALQARQDALLSALWPLLKPSGMLLYVTCSILPRENVQRVSAFVAQQADAVELRIEPTDWGRGCERGRQILPGEAGMDGFYFARIQKTA